MEPPANDARIRVLPYAADEVYRLRGYVGFQIDVEFEAGETFVGLGAGDMESLTFSSQSNHLFLKPRASPIDTNLTVLTSRRVYHFDYSVNGRDPDAAFGNVIYVLRFTYSSEPDRSAADSLDRRLSGATDARHHNLRFAYHGSLLLKPESAWDDGVQTHLRFGAQQELPAVFIRNDDGSESLLNFSLEQGDIVVQRVAREFLVRRGHLHGCIVNQGFAGSGERLPSGTVAPSVERITKGVQR
ncbi:MAG: TrbG/VirB9 family P-type conjugative transfer protein [Gammaproteobacteria bacterium]|nr:TrbG/VirB9 family P-type conjugative transfer protein [Gammaproteobacteria bacterium]